jgi:hypothetical protein
LLVIVGLFYPLAYDSQKAVLLRKKRKPTFKGILSCRGREMIEFDRLYPVTINTEHGLNLPRPY